MTLAAAPASAGGPRRRRGRSDARLGLALTLPVTLLMAALVLVPLLVTLVESFYRVEPMKPGTPFVGLRNYVTLWKDPAVAKAWTNTLVYVLAAVAIETLGGLAAALTINAVRSGRRWLLAALVLPWCLPPVVNAIVWGWIFNPSYGLLNGVLLRLGIIDAPQVWMAERWSALLLIALVHAWRMLPLTAIILLAALQSIPATLYEAARMDGASPWRQFRHITLPLLGGAFAIAMSQSAVFAINLFDEAWILNGSALGTRPVIVQVYMLAFQSMKFSLGMALSILAMAASLVLSGVFVWRLYRETRLD